MAWMYFELLNKFLTEKKFAPARVQKEDRQPHMSGPTNSLRCLNNSATGTLSSYQASYEINFYR